MELNARIETAESVKEKAKNALGFDLSSVFDIVKRGDYDSDEAYLDACTRAELERSSPEYRAARSRRTCPPRSFRKSYCRVRSGRDH